eukprot:scaffold270_cov390-Prasinococcus_capsulatus_cf.AAC.17
MGTVSSTNNNNNEDTGNEEPSSALRQRLIAVLACLLDPMSCRRQWQRQLRSLWYFHISCSRNLLGLGNDRLLHAQVLGAPAASAATVGHSSQLDTTDRRDLERQQHERELEAVAIDEESVGKELEFTPEEADALQEHLGADYTCPISMLFCQGHRRSLRLPDILRCTTGRDVFHNPVIAADGKTYDYKYIRSWLGVRAISPLTNTPMSHCNLEPDVETRDEIEKALTELREKVGHMCSSIRCCTRD